MCVCVCLIVRRLKIIIDKCNPSKHVVGQLPPKASTKSHVKPPTESPAEIIAKIRAPKNMASARICTKKVPEMYSVDYS